MSTFSVAMGCCLQVARAHLARLRHQLVGDREAHAAALLLLLSPSKLYTRPHSVWPWVAASRWDNL
jgi:hypothetical protein